MIGLHWIELKAHFIGSGATNGIRLAMGPEKMGMLQQEGERMFLTPEQGVELTLDGEPVTGSVALHDDTSETPSVLGFDEGKGLVTVIVRDGRRALRVKPQLGSATGRERGCPYV